MKAMKREREAVGNDVFNPGIERTPTRHEQGTVAAVWMIYTVLFGYPTNDDTKFDNETACQIYLHTQYGRRGCTVSS